MKLHLNLLERSRELRNEGKKFSFALFTFKFSFAAPFVKTTILFVKPKHVQIAQKRNY